VSKFSNMLRLVLKLQEGRTYKIEELACMLEVTPRQIRRYRDELEMSGIYIQAQRGKDGGYYLDADSETISVESTPEDEMLFRELFKDEKTIPIKKLTEMYASFMRTPGNLDPLFDTLSISEIKHYIMLDYAVKKSLKTGIEYIPANQKFLIRTVHPYFLFTKRGSPYLAAYEEARRAIIYLKLARMRTVACKDVKFSIDEALHKKEKRIVQENQGVFYSGALISVRFHFPRSLAWMLEDIFGHHEKSIVDEKTLDVKVKTGSLSEMKPLLLSLGSKIVVHEPASLRASMIEELEKARKHYG